MPAPAELAVDARDELAMRSVAKPLAEALQALVVDRDDHRGGPSGGARPHACIQIEADQPQAAERPVARGQEQARPEHERAEPRGAARVRWPVDDQAKDGGHVRGPMTRPS